MKTLPIRCHPNDTIHIRALTLEKQRSPGDPKDEGARDSCPTLKFFQEAKNKCPDSWADLLATLNETAANGLPENDSKFKHLTDGICEFKSWGLRLLCFKDDGAIIVCTHGFYKKRQATPAKEISRAQTMRRAYLEAKKRDQINHVEPKQIR